MPEARSFVQKLSDGLSLKWEQPFSVVSSYKEGLVYHLCCSVVCVCGSCTKWRGLGIVDGANADS